MRLLLTLPLLPIALTSVAITVASVLLLESLEKRGEQVAEGRHG